MYRKIISVFISLIAILTIGVSSVLAHVTVKPAEVSVGSRLNFTVSVPTEGDNPTTEVRLIIPEGLQSIRPNAKAGWNIQIKKDGEGEEAKVTELIWSGGRIPAEQRDEFIFSAQAPAEEITLVWKAYQTYSDGTVVAWDADPKTITEGGHDDHESAKPWSETKVINDFEISETKSTNRIKEKLPLILSTIALLGAGTSIWMQIRKR